MYGFGAIGDCGSMGAEGPPASSSDGASVAFESRAGDAVSCTPGLGLDDLYTRDDGRK